MSTFAESEEAMNRCALQRYVYAMQKHDYALHRHAVIQSGGVVFSFRLPFSY